jgi:hypothetical protein
VISITSDYITFCEVRPAMPFIRHTKRPPLPFTPIAIFILAVLVPSIALSFLALRAAEREAVYVERRLESALMAEVGLAAASIEGLMDDILSALDREAASFGGGDDALMARWSKTNPLVDTPFRLIGGRVETVTAEGRGGPGDLTASFGDFLEGRGRLPTYDLVTRIYRYDADTDSAESKSSAARSAKALSGMTAEPPAPMMSYEESAPKPPGMTRRSSKTGNRRTHALRRSQGADPSASSPPPATGACSPSCRTGGSRYSSGPAPAKLMRKR